MCRTFFFVTTNSLNECFFLSYLEYITKFHCLSRIRLFQRICEILPNRRNRQKLITSKVPMCDVREIMQIRCVTGQVLMNFLYKIFLINYCENVFEIQRWHVKLGTKRKLFTYLGTNGFDEKRLKYGCKGLVQLQKEASKPNRGCCCQGLKILRYSWYFVYFQYFHYLKNSVFFFSNVGNYYMKTTF